MDTQKLPTIYDIAEQLGISSSTVSRALADNATVKTTTKKRVLAAAAELGYRTNTFAQSLRNGKTHTIGVIVPRLKSQFISSVLAGMETTAAKNGYNLLICQSLESFEKEKAAVATMYNKQVDGLVISLAADTEGTAHLASLRKRKIPVICFDRADYSEEFTSISADNFNGSWKATRHLIDSGCKRLMHIGGNTNRKLYAERLAGFRRALADSNLPFDKTLHLQTELTEEAGIGAAEYIIGLADKPDGIFVANDNCAIHCMLRLQQAGIHVPKEIAIAGFNNDPMTRMVEPRLTTVNYPGDILGTSTIQAMLDHIDGATPLENTSTIILRTDLIVRDSSLKNKNC